MATPALALPAPSLRARAVAAAAARSGPARSGPAHGGAATARRPRVVVAAAAKAEPTGCGTLAHMSVEQFQSMLDGSPLPVLVGVCTTWCGPCHQLSRNMKVIEPVMQERVRFEKLDAEINPELASHFGIHLLPTLLLFRSGQLLDRSEGLMSAQDLQMHLMKLLK